MDLLHLGALCRWLLIVVLAVAACAKAIDMAGFAASLRDGFSVPPALSRPVAFAIVAAEAAVAIALLRGGAAAQPAAVAALLLFVLFTSAIAYSLLVKRRVACRCFGGASQELSGMDIARNSLYMLAALLYLAAGQSQAVPGGLGAQVLLACAALLLFLVSLSLNDIRNLLR